MPTTFRTVGNRAVSTLNGFVFAADGTWTVTDGSVFPAGNFMVTCENEIALCTGRIGNVLTVTRAQDGTFSADHPDGSSVESRIVSSLFNNIHTAINNLEGTGIISMPSATQNLVAATTVVADALTIQISSVGDIVLTANPLIADGTSDGQLLFIWNVGNFNITLNTNNLQFGNANSPPTLKSKDTLLLQWSDTLSLWLEQDSALQFTLSGVTLNATHAWEANDYFGENIPASPNTLDDEFNDTTGMSGAVNGLNARWTWRNQGGASVSFGKPGYITISPASASGWRILEQNEPAGNYTFEAKFSMDSALTVSQYGGIVLVDGVNGDLYSIQFGAFSAGNRLRIEVDRWTNVTTFSSNLISFGHNVPLTELWLRVSWDGANYSVYWSTDGVGWTLFHTFADAVVVTKVGIGFLVETFNAVQQLHCDYFRRTA